MTSDPPSPGYASEAEEDNSHNREEGNGASQNDPDAAGDAAKTEEEQKPEKKKRIIRNPQPKLDPDRITGPRGVGQLEDIFKDFKDQGTFLLEFIIRTIFPICYF